MNRSLANALFLAFTALILTRIVAAFTDAGSGTCH